MSPAAADMPVDGGPPPSRASLVSEPSQTPPSSSVMAHAAHALYAAAHPHDGETDKLSRRGFGWCTGTLFVSSWVSGAQNMLLLLATLSAGHSILQVAIIFAAFQFAGAVGAIAAGNVLALYGLRSMLMGTFFLQALALALLIPLRHSHADHPGRYQMTLTEATIYSTAIQLVNGLARVFARLATKTLPRLAEAPPPKRHAKDHERGLMIKTALVFGGRTFVRGSGFLVGGVLLQYAGFTWGLVILTMISLPTCFIPLFTVPECVGRSVDVKWDAKHLFVFSKNMYAITALQLLQNAGQYAWLQVPITHMLRSPYAAFRLSHVTVSAVMSGIMCYEGLQQTVLGLPMLRALRHTPPHTSKWVLTLWSTLAAAGGVPLAVLSLATSLFASPPEESRGGAIALFFVALLAMIAPTQIVNILGNFVYQHYTDRTRTGPTAGFNTAAQATGRGLGTLASGVLFAAIYHGPARGTTPVPGFGASIVFTVLTSVACAVIASMSFAGYGGDVLQCGPCLECGGGAASGTSRAPSAKSSSAPSKAATAEGSVVPPLAGKMER